MFDNSKIIEINKGSSIKEINDYLFFDKNILNKNIYLFTLNFSNKFFKKIHYGEFLIEDNATLYNVLKIISYTSNINKKITIVEGWNKLQLNNYLLEKFDLIYDIDYEEILAETYYLKSKNSLENLHKHMKDYKNNYFQKYKDNIIFKTYTATEIMIIGSIIEKEAIDDYDKKLISSVIFNRLKKNMRLQIDATVIFALTNGSYIFNRKLTYSDLKIANEFNTYHIHGLPPKPISYVGRKTIDIIMENYKSNYLFYFYNKYKNLHIYSKSFAEHKKKLNEYRKK